MIHQSFGDLIGEWHIQATRDVDGRELRLLEGPVARELLSLARQVGPLRVGLGADGYVLAGSHRHRPGYQAGHPGDQDVASRRVRGGHADEQARGRHDAVVCAQDGGAQPTDSLRTVALAMSSRHTSSPRGRAV